MKICEDRLPHNRYKTRLYYGYETTENGEIFHSFELDDPRNLFQEDMGDILKDSLDVSEGSEFDWNYMLVNIPETVVAQIKSDAIQEYLAQHQNPAVSQETRQKSILISLEKLQELRKRFPVGSWIKLVKMEGEENGPKPGDLGIVRSVDDIGTIHPAWINGGSLGVVYGKDICCQKDFPDVTNQI